MISFLTDKLRKITVLDQQEVCFLFQVLKLWKIGGKNWWHKLVKTSDEFVIRWEKKLQTMSYSCKRKQQVVSSVELSSESKVLLLMEAFCFFLSPSMVAAFLIKKNRRKNSSRKNIIQHYQALRSPAFLWQVKCLKIVYSLFN